MTYRFKLVDIGYTRNQKAAEAEIGIVTLEGIDGHGKVTRIHLPTAMLRLDARFEEWVQALMDDESEFPSQDRELPLMEFAITTALLPEGAVAP